MRSFTERHADSLIQNQHYQEVIRNLVKRYVAAMIRNSKTNEGLTEENFKELKQDISSFRYEVLDLLGNRKHPRRSLSTSSADFSQRDDTNDGSGGARAKSKSVSFNVGCKKKACHGAPLIRTVPRASGAQGKPKSESSSKRSFMGPSFKKLGLFFSKFNGQTSEPTSEPMYTISDGIAQQHCMWQDIRYSQMEKGKAEACSQSQMNLGEVELGEIRGAAARSSECPLACSSSLHCASGICSSNSKLLDSSEDVFETWGEACDLLMHKWGDGQEEQVTTRL